MVDALKAPKPKDEAKYPILNYLKQSGGLDPHDEFGKRLQDDGITNQSSVPGLFTEPRYVASTNRWLGKSTLEGKSPNDLPEHIRDLLPAGDPNAGMDLDRAQEAIRNEVHRAGAGRFSEDPALHDLSAEMQQRGIDTKGKSSDETARAIIEARTQDAHEAAKAMGASLNDRQARDVASLFHSGYDMQDALDEVMERSAHEAHNEVVGRHGEIGHEEIPWDDIAEAREAPEAVTDDTGRAAEIDRQHKALADEIAAGESGRTAHDTAPAESGSDTGTARSQGAAGAGQEVEPSLFNAKEDSAADTARRTADQRIKGGAGQKSVDDLGLFGEGRAKDQKTMFHRGLRSTLSDAATALKQEKGSGEQYLAQLKNTPGVKEEELAWTGLDDFLKAKGKEPVTKQEIQDHLAKNQVKIEPVTLGEEAHTKRAKELAKEAGEDWDKIGGGGQAHYRNDALSEFRILGRALVPSVEGETKFGQHTLPGGQNYREVLLTLPQKSPDFTHVRVTQDSMGNWHGEEFGPKGNPHGYVTGDYTTRETARRKTQQYSDEYGVAFHQPENEVFKSSHFPDQPNILAHLRLNDRIDADGKKVLFIEEIQSDWHQKGRRIGYKLPQKLFDMLDARRRELEKMGGEARNRGEEIPSALKQEWADIMNKMGGLGGQESKIADAPFKKTWHEMVMRRAIQMAAQGGYDRVAWTTGEQQNERFDLSKQVGKLTLYEKDGKFSLSAWKPDGSNAIDLRPVTKDELPDVIGKEAADRILAAEPDKRGARTLEGVELKIGGEGMKGFYDKILPQYAKKFASKFGGDVGQTRIKTDNAPDDVVARYANQPDHPFTKRQFATVHSMPITDSMRQTAKESGFPLFKKGAEGAGNGQINHNTHRTWVGEPAAGIVGVPARGWSKNESALISAVATELKRMVPGTDVKAFQNIYATNGSTGVPTGEVHGVAMDKHGNIPHLIAYALRGPEDTMQTANHEVIHTLRNMGLIDDKRWQTLQDHAARNKWLQKYDISAKYPELSKEGQMEEAIAHGFPDWRAGRLKVSPGVAGIFQKIKQFLGNVAGKARAVLGKDATAADVFRDIESGKQAGSGPISAGRTQQAVKSGGPRPKTKPAG